jgi:O-antigen/teichoic acid export membrane protein
MLYRMRGAGEVGLYAVPVRVVEFANIVPSVFVASAFPLLARLAGSADARRLDFATAMSLRAMAWTALPLGVYLFAYPEPCLRVLFGAQFSDAAQTMRILAFSPAFAFLNSILFNRLLAARQQRISAALAGAAAAINVCLNLGLIPAFGGTGAAIATVVAYGAVPAIAALVADSSEVGRIALWSLVRPSIAAAVSLATVEWIGLDPLSGAFVVMVSYVSGLFLMREVGQTEMRVLFRAIGWQTRGPALP